jgi:NitT/TauT family transport system substrate-binding protein
MKQTISRQNLIVAATAAAASLATRPARAQAGFIIRVAAIPIDVGANGYYASELGFFKKHGLDANVSTGASGAAVAAAVVGGSLDIGDGNSTVLAQAHERGVGLVMIAPSGMYRAVEPTSALLVAKTSTLKTPKDLAGKTIGVATIKSLGEVAMRAWFERSGVSDPKFIEIPYSAMNAALVAGRIDAACAEEPAVSVMLAADSKVIARPYDEIAQEFVEGGFFCTLDFAKKNLDVIKRFADAIAEANAWANTHRDQSFELVSKYSKSPFMKTMARMWYPERLRTVDLQPLIDASAKYGLLQKAFPAKELFAPGIEG